MELDNTYRSMFASCKRKYYLVRGLSLSPRQGSHALRYGSTFHGMMEGFYSTIKEKGWSSKDEAIKNGFAYGKAVWEHESERREFSGPDYRTLENALESFISYCTEYSYDEGLLEVVETEKAFKIPIILSKEEEKKFPFLYQEDIYFTGILDMQVMMSGLHYIVEHKTTGQNISIQINRLHRSPQILGYTYAGKYLNNNITGCLVSLHQLSCRMKKDGTWGKKTVEFRRSPEIFSDEDLQQWRESFLSTCNEIVFHVGHNTWPMQFDSCYNFGRCSFCDLCERNLSLEELTFDVRRGILPEGYIQDRTNIFEISTSKLITNRRILKDAVS